MLKEITSVLRLFIRFAQLGGMAGSALFLTQGEFAKAIQCSCVAALCIVLLSLAMKAGGK